VTDTATPVHVGRYRIDGVLGAGAMAVVYAGFDPQIEREVAIKCLHAEVAADPAYRQRFLAEARAAGHLTHPHIVTIFDVGETRDGRAWIAMERLPGSTLAERVAREGFPPLPVIIELLQQIAGALDYAHAHGVVHHDIKPDNIIVADGWQAKINDFGIAERRTATATPRDPRREMGGTPAYMAPEHLRGETSDARSDLFSLGVIAHWLLGGALPWPDIDDVPTLLRERQRVPLPPLQPRDAATPSMLVDIVHTLLDPLAAARYQHGAEVVADLRLARREYERRRDTPLANRLVSLRVRWVAILGAVLSLTLLLGLAAIHARQNAAITGLALDFGSSMGRMIASEAAENLLLGDQPGTRALVEDMARNQQIHYLAIADRYGKVIASTRREQIGSALPALAAHSRLAAGGDTASYRVPAADAGQADMLLFDVPVRYQAASVGALRLGVSTAPLRAAQRTMLGVIAAVLALTLLAVVGAAWWLSRRLATLLDLITDGLLRVARGDTRHRIRLVRRDELGRLFAAFNVMAGALHKRPSPPAPAATATALTPQPTRILSVPQREDDAVMPE
jgi:serine/threonine-protein kinase